MVGATRFSCGGSDTHIRFGPGSAPEAARATSAYGACALVVTGTSIHRAKPLIADLEARHLRCVLFSLAGEPTVERVRPGIDEARREKCDVVIAIGGGSAIDAGKTLAAMVTNPGDVLDYLEVVGRNREMHEPSLPFIAVPTTAGTGAEVTGYAVLGSTELSVKASLRSIWMKPRFAVVDPELTSDMPPSVTASTGLGALTQLIEPYVSPYANPMSDLYCVEGLRAAAGALPLAWSSGHNREARANMSWASLLSGLAIWLSKCGATHGFSVAVGGMFQAPHGAVCAAVLPHAMAINVRALRSHGPESRALSRYEEVARLLTGDPQAVAADGVRWVTDLCHRLEIPPLRAYGVTASDVPVLVEKAAKANSMRGNSIVLTAEELSELITNAL